jgi:hypothetical protein
MLLLSSCFDAPRGSIEPEDEFLTGLLGAFQKEVLKPEIGSRLSVPTILRVCLSRQPGSRLTNFCSNAACSRRNNFFAPNGN